MANLRQKRIATVGRAGISTELQCCRRLRGELNKSLSPVVACRAFRTRQKTCREHSAPVAVRRCLARTGSACASFPIALSPEPRAEKCPRKCDRRCIFFTGIGLSTYRTSCRSTSTGGTARLTKLSYAATSKCLRISAPSVRDMRHVGERPQLPESCLWSVRRRGQAAFQLRRR